ncbi:MAG: VWA domain-containing protein [Candidatus Gastranaerophilales bacterium]|nr:VWA domain-containing protein [Candidatus Gastranaerophilales bacterium]
MKLTDCKNLSLRKVKISGNVIGKFGTFEVEQTFFNDTNKVLEVGYTFPIAETATVVGFEVCIGDKVLKGQCKETSKAKKEYAKNIVKGNSAYLMEEKSDNIFSITIGKLAKKEEVKIKINYIDKFDIVDNQVQIFIPTLVPPKYNSPVTDKLNYEKVDYKADFQINIAKNVKCLNIQSPTHKFELDENEQGKSVKVLNYDMSKDFKLYFDLANELTSNALIFKTRDDKEVLYMSFMPEITDSYEDSEKEYLFLVDVSGSMDGEKLEETKKAVLKCLKQLDDGDKFNIIPFESEFRAMSVNSVEYNEENLEKAKEYIKSLKANGGTEILDPIKFALFEENADKIILLFTDGEVGNEGEIISYVENHISTSRLFPFGIDYNVNSYFLRDLAKIGNGKAELIMPHERIDDKIIRTFARIQTPLLEDLKIDYGSNRLVDEIREDNALFNYEFYNVFAKIEKLEDDITLRGKILDKENFWTIKKDDIINTTSDLEVLFAKSEIDRLEDYIRNCDDDDKIQTYKELIIELSEKYNINSRYTSFLTVYERENKILEVPTYQETTLSNKFSQIFSSISNVFTSESFDDDCINYCIDVPDFITNSKSTDNDPFYYHSLPDFKDKNGKYNNQPRPKTDQEKLQDKTDEYFEFFIKQDDKSLITYLLFALYYLNGEKNTFNCDELLCYLTKNKDIVLENQEAQELLYLLCYHGKMQPEDIKPFMKKDFYKAAVTKLWLNIERFAIDEKYFSKILEQNVVGDYIDKILWTFYCPK